MDIQLAEQRLFVLSEKISQEQARLRAMDKRAGLFVSGLGTLIIQRPKTEEIELMGAQKRFEPFWHVVCTPRHVYDRSRKINVLAGGPEVKMIRVRLNSVDRQCKGRALRLPTCGRPRGSPLRLNQI